MKYLIATLLILSNVFLFAQSSVDTIYLTENSEVTKSIDSSKYYKIIKKEKGLYFISEYFTQSDSIKKSSSFKDKELKIREGEFVYYKNGIPSSRITYKDDKENGLSSNYYESGELFYTEDYVNGVQQDLIVYYKNGSLKRKEIYTGEKIRECYKPNGEKGEFYEFTVAATYPDGGMNGVKQFLIENMRYPSEAYEKKIMGKVFMGFSVSKTGEITNVKIKKSAHPLLDAEAIRVIKSMPKWTPGMLDGEPVDSYFSMPINFSF